MVRNLLFITLFFVLLLGCNSKAKENTPISATQDSIRKYLALARNSTLDFEERIKYNDKAISLLDLKKNDSLTRENLNAVIYNYAFAKASNKYKIYSATYYSKCIEAKDTLGFARYYRCKGLFFKNTGVFDSAFYYYLKAEKLYKIVGDEEGIAYCNSKLSSIQYRLDNYLGAELSAEKALRYFRKVKNVKEQFHLLTAIGNSNSNLKNHKKASRFFELALLLTKKINPDKKDISYTGTCLNNIGNTYRVQKKYSNAIYFFKLGLKEKDLLIKDPEIYAYLLCNLGHCYLKINNNSKLPYLFNQSKKIFDSLEIKNESAICDVYLSEYYMEKGDRTAGIFYSERALQLAKAANAPYYYLTALSNAGSINPDKAPEYIKEYHKKNDSLLFVERNARNQYYKIQLETDEISTQKNVALQQRSIVTGVAIILLIIIILLYVISHQRIKQKELKLVQAQQKANEEIYQLMLSQKNYEEAVRESEKKRIALELHDGVMNRLTSIRLNLSVIKRLKDEATLEKCMEYVNDIFNVETEIRNITHELRDSQAAYDFEKLLKEFINQQNDSAQVKYSLEIQNAINWDLLADVKKMNLYRIIQESGQNINKHAKAQNAIISIRTKNNHLYLSITDDGIGFNSSIPGKGIGLKNMEYRVKQMNGKLSFHSEPSKSTSVNIMIPLKKRH